MAHSDLYQEYCAAFEAHRSYQRIVNMNESPCGKMLAELEKRTMTMNHAWQRHEAEIDANRINSRLMNQFRAELSLRELSIDDYCLTSV